MGLRTAASCLQPIPGSVAQASRDKERTPVAVQTNRVLESGHVERQFSIVGSAGWFLTSLIAVCSQRIGALAGSR